MYIEPVCCTMCMVVKMWVGSTCVMCNGFDFRCLLLLENTSICVLTWECVVGGGGPVGLSHALCVSSSYLILPGTSSNVVWLARPSRKRPVGVEGKGRPFPSTPTGRLRDGLASQTTSNAALHGLPSPVYSCSHFVKKGWTLYQCISQYSRSFLMITQFSTPQN